MLKALVCLTLITLMIFSNVTPAYAWKVKTHVYSATLTSFIYNMDYGYDWNEEALIASGFFLGQNGSDQNLVTRLIFNLDGSKRPSFSDMTQGPIHVATNKLYSPGEAPKVKVKYENAPDQINAIIGLYPADDYSTSTHNWKNIARNTSGEYEATLPQKGGKYHFRIYDNQYKLLASSDTIEVIERDAELKSYFEAFSTEKFEPLQKMSVNFVNELKKNGFIALYRDSETNPQYFEDIKQELKGNGIISILTSAPETPGRYRYRAYDENMKLIAESGLIFVEGPPRQILTDIKTIDANEIADYIERVGSVFNINIRGSLNGSVWGDGIYTIDSDVATAAVHAGIVKPWETKTVKITILPGKDSYAGTIKNGVESYEYGEWPGSFEFTDLSMSTSPQNNLLTETKKEDNR